MAVRRPCEPTKTSRAPAVVDRRTPPVELGIAGLVCLVTAVAALTGSVVFPVPAVLALVLCAVVRARRAWARTLLVVLTTAEAVVLIHTASGDPGHGSLERLLHAGASVLVLVTVSSDGARRWVSARR